MFSKLFDNFIVTALTTVFRTSWDLLTPENIGQAIGAVAAGLAIIISMIHICRHWKYNRTKLRKSTVRLLFVVPIFALDCWACLMLETSLYHWAELLTCIREVYEAVALVSFMELTLTMLGGTQNLCEALMADVEDVNNLPPVQHVWPLSKCLPPFWTQGPDFLRNVLRGIFQYVYVTVASMAIMFLLWGLWRVGILDESTLVILRKVPGAMKVVSCAYALNCLLLFAHEIYAHIPPCNLFLKFLSIKGIVFFTFWQGFVIWILQERGLLARAEDYITEKTIAKGMDPQWWDDSQIKSGLNDLLLCIEVLCFSILHYFAYPAKEQDTFPAIVKVRVTPEEDHMDSPHRVLSAVNLMNMARLFEETGRLKEMAPPQLRRHVTLSSRARQCWNKFVRSQWLGSEDVQCPLAPAASS